MYIPNFNLMTDQAEAIDFMQKFSFATIVTVKDNLPVASHLPFLIRKEGDGIILTSHFAKANDQWKEMELNTALVIFTEPHAYISPKHYDKELSVPTWNYLSVHAYGKAKIINEVEKVISLLESTIDNYEEAYKKQWNGLPEEFKLGMIKGIVAFEILVTDLQAKKKLSQNKNEQEQRRIIDALSESNDKNEQSIAEYMKNNNNP